MYQKNRMVVLSRKLYNAEFQDLILNLRERIGLSFMIAQVVECHSLNTHIYTEKYFSNKKQATIDIALNG